jgi:hypothetical protein
MNSAWKIGEGVAYVFAAERVISGKIAGMAPVDTEDTSPVGWHLEDPDGETIDDAYPVVAAREAFQVLAKPMAALSLDEAGGMRQSRRTQWELTSRHAGLCGTSFWVLDGLNGWGFPRAILYCRPDRLTPKLNAQGALAEWRLDVGAIGKPDGTPISREEVVPFYLQAPNDGYVATGLVEAALVKAQLNGASTFPSHAGVALRHPRPRRRRDRGREHLSAIGQGLAQRDRNGPGGQAAPGRAAPVSHGPSTPREMG